MFVQHEHVGKDKVADTGHLGQPLWIHWRFGKTINIEGLWQNAVKVQEQNQLQPEFFPPSTHDKIIYKWPV